MLLNSACSVGQTSRSNCEGETSDLEQQACLSAKRRCLPTRTSVNISTISLTAQVQDPYYTYSQQKC